MDKKTKRKGNPRRQLLLQLLIVIVMIAALVAIGINALRPKGAEIVFIAPDDNGIDNIWIADLNDPDNPRQLTAYNESWISIWTVLTASESDTILWIKPESPDNRITIWTYNLQTHEIQSLLMCQRCNDFTLHPNGRWLAYQENSPDDNINIFIYDLQTEEHILVDTIFDGYTHTYYEPHPQWMGKNAVLVYRTQGDLRNEFGFFSVNDRQSDYQSLNVSYFTPDFSLDSQYFAFYPVHPVIFPNTVSVSMFSSGGESYPIFTLQSENKDNTLRQAFVLAWHPDSQSFIANEIWCDFECNQVTRYLNLYYPATGEVNTLAVSREYSYLEARFNHNGSQIIYRQSRNNLPHQLILYNLDTGEEIALPLFGRDPQWVNGGR